eukprot:12471261-Heterocapsa_arctica.AAC.1
MLTRVKARTAIRGPLGLFVFIEHVIPPEAIVKTVLDCALKLRLGVLFALAVDQRIRHQLTIAVRHLWLRQSRYRHRHRHCRSRNVHPALSPNNWGTGEDEKNVTIRAAGVT